MEQTIVDVCLISLLVADVTAMGIILFLARRL